MGKNQVIENKSGKRTAPLSFSRTLFDLLETLTVAIAIVFLIFISGVRLCRVQGDSMVNTLHNAENLIVCDWFYEPKNGDIIVFHQTSEIDTRLNEPIVKRIIATEGQFLWIDAENAAVYVSNDDTFSENERLDEPYAYLPFGTMYDNYGASGKIFEVPKGHVFVMGDNRNNSVDSRYPIIGFVNTERILGKVILRLTPLNQFGKVE